MAWIVATGLFSLQMLRRSAPQGTGLHQATLAAHFGRRIAAWTVATRFLQFSAVGHRMTGSVLGAWTVAMRFPSGHPQGREGKCISRSGLEGCCSAGRRREGAKMTAPLASHSASAKAGDLASTRATHVNLHDVCLQDEPVHCHWRIPRWEFGGSAVNTIG